MDNKLRRKILWMDIWKMLVIVPPHNLLGLYKVNTRKLEGKYRPQIDAWVVEKSRFVSIQGHSLRSFASLELEIQVSLILKRKSINILARNCLCWHTQHRCSLQNQIYFSILWVRLYIRSPKWNYWEQTRITFV